MIPRKVIERWKRLVWEIAPESRITEFRNHKHYLVVDLPRHVAELHGSSFAIECKNSDCYIEADLVAYPEFVDIIKKDVERMGCKVEEIHIHGYLSEVDHVHVVCKKKIDEVDELIEYFRVF